MARKGTNMDRETAKRLLAKGVDASIILDELLGEEAEPEVPAPAKPAAEVKEPAPAPEPKKDQQPDPILAAIEKLTGTIQAMNARTRSFEPQPAETVDDILAAALGGNKND